jgi:hypothetical protein
MSIVRPSRAVAALLSIALAGCAGVATQHPAVVLSSNSTNAVAYWHDIGAATVSATVTPATTPEELRPSFAADLATMHLAMYDAVSAIDRRFKPYLYKPASPAAGASMDAAASAAAYGVLRALYPNRDAHYQAAYDSYVAAIPAGEAKTRGLALDSVAYAADVNEVKAFGGTVSTARTAAQLETARFHSEPPTPYFTRNFGRFARSTTDVPQAARLLAVIYTGYADAIAACMDAKYFYQSWRPLSAIPLAETDNNAATVADPAWTPILPTPVHPEYPAAHSCSAAALGELLRQYYGTDRVAYSVDSKVTGTTRVYTTTDGLADDSKVARIYGGMHFRYSTTAGAKLGKEVANWTMQRYFGPTN